MAGKRGRKSKYDEYVAPYIEQITEWVQAGATQEEISKALDISITTINEYKKKYPKFAKAFARGRATVCIEIRAALKKSATGYFEEEEKRVGRKDKNGENIILVEKYRRWYPPNPAAAGMLLRNYDKDWRDTDETSVQMRQQEHELRKAIAEANNFDLNLTGEEKNAE